MAALRYFAYGSNMDHDTLRAWCADARVIGTARLPGFRFDLRRRSIRWHAGVADLVEAPGDEVWGVLYELPADALRTLDEKEGVGIGAYARRSVVVEVAGADPLDAIAYAVVEKEAQRVAPSPEYADLLLGAAARAGLPAVYRARLEELLR